mgnify:CR=1 FL=1
MDFLTTEQNQRIEADRSRYDSLQREATYNNLRALNAIGNNINVLPDTIRKYREICEAATQADTETLRRIAGILHTVLIDRMYYNEQFTSPLYTHDLNNLRAFSFKIEQLQN